MTWLIQVGTYNAIETQKAPQIILSDETFFYMNNLVDMAIDGVLWARLIGKTTPVTEDLIERFESAIEDFSRYYTKELNFIVSSHGYAFHKMDAVRRMMKSEFEKRRSVYIRVS